MKDRSRNTWLSKALELLREDFSSIGVPIPDNVHVNSGWPDTDFLLDRLGESHLPPHPDDGYSIFIISEDTTVVLETLVHELVHIDAGIGAGHGDRFRVVAEAIGLEGKMTVTHAGESLLSRLRDIEQELGAYPQNLGWFSKLASRLASDFFQNFRI